MDNLWDFQIWNNTIRDWSITFGIIAGIVLLLRLIQHLVIRRIKAFTARTRTTIDDFIITLIHSSVMPLLYVLTVYYGLRYLRLPDSALSIANVAVMVVITFFVLRMISSTINYLFRQALSGNGNIEERRKQSKGIVLIIHILVWLLGVLFLVDNLGYDITTLVAGLGIGGIAIALAAQTILGDLFSYFVIFFDKPFEVGDFIIVDDKMGTVERVGIKTTRIRSLGGEQLVMSNTNLTNSRMHNYKRMNERRVVFRFGVEYSTAARKLRLIPQLVQRIIGSVSETRFDRAHFQVFGDFSLNFEVVYYALTADYNVYMDKQQEINLKIFELFEKEQIVFAFPTQTVLINKKEEMA